MRPIRLFDLELTGPIPHIPLIHPEARENYRQVQCLVRAHTRPLGILEFRSAGDEIKAETAAREIWNVFGVRILEHLEENGLPAISSLDSSGIPNLGMPTCLAQRQEILWKQPFVSIVIATRERPDKLSKCLNSFLNVEYSNYEIILVDNAPTSTATCEAANHAKGSLQNLQYWVESRPGLSYARNCGLSHARGDFIAFTDDDVIPDRYWITEILRGFLSASHAACVTGLILPLELETSPQIWLEQFGGFSKGFTRRIYDQGDHRPKDRLFPYAAGAFGSGGNIAFRTPILRSLGGFDPALGAGSMALSGEELATFVQLIHRGHQILYEPGALVFHHHHREYEALKKQIYGYGVGLTAYVMKCLLDDPRLVKDIGRKFFSGLSYALNPRSKKNRDKGKDYPAELTRLELLGMLSGPFAYLYSRRRSGQNSREN